MKKMGFMAVLALSGLWVSAQSGSGFGIKGGLNYNANGDYYETTTEVVKNPSRNLGYHVGIFGKLGNRLYIRPELVYTFTKSDYDEDTFEMKKLDAPILVGIKIIGPLHIFAGPAFEYILDSNFDGVSIDRIEDDFTVGGQFGVGVNLGKLGADIRYERGLSSNEAQFINTNFTQLPPSRIDTRPDQIILSLSIKL